jgi:hypothetical protein
LQQCLDEVPILQTVNRLRMRDAFSALRLRLWDEQAQKLVGYNREQ